MSQVHHKKKIHRIPLSLQESPTAECAISRTCGDGCRIETRVPRTVTRLDEILKLQEEGGRVKCE
eukprot:CAMPEP_0197247180 /NCGR_PEP_ID=MMETSP1429-20130617/26246_1 /TAXON_ID=49237 /ORGANISM="Chaetoceros  sp., Strain UNC1202" /LENGTH=64 /DNA_ID=CAMNT_0042708023 /DNA_START=13 /DNA_END=207 /DNA_ORIENTATION=+